MRWIVFSCGPASGERYLTADPVGAELTRYGVRYVITDMWTVHGYVAEWDGQWC